MRFSATFLRGIYFIYSVALCASQLVYFVAAILLHFQYVSFVVAVVLVVACCTQSFNPNVLFATTLSYAHSSNHNRSNKQRQRQQAQKQQHSCAGSVVCLSWPGLAWLGLASTISCPCKLFVDNFVCYKSPRASVRTIQASPEANSSVPLPPRQCCSSPLAVSVQQSVKERAVTIHKTKRGRGRRRKEGRSVFWALLNCRSNDCK